MPTHPDDVEGRARQAASQLRRASEVQGPHFSDVLRLARAGRLVSAAMAVALLSFLGGMAFAFGSVVGPVALDWLAGGILVALVLVTAAISAHAGGHAWFVPLPGALLALLWLVSVSAHHRHASAWWLLAASAAFSGVAVLLAAGVLRSRVVSRSIPAATLAGQAGVAVTDLAPTGIARVRGETWTAESLSGDLSAGTKLHVVRVEGLRLLVWSEEGRVLGAETLPGGVES